MENKSQIPTAYEGTSPYIFISYAHKDAGVVLPIIKALSEMGFRIWYDAGIEAGTEWPEYIAAHLEKSACVLAFLSASAVASFNCRQEINYAIDLQKPMLTVYLEELALTGGMRMRLGLSQAMFYHRHPTLDSFVKELSLSELLLPCLGQKAVADLEQAAEELAVAPRAEAKASDSDFLIQGGVLLEYRGKGGKVVIPEGVTAIGHAAFINNTVVSEVVIPDSVCEIAQAAFQSCTKLTRVLIPGSVKAVGHAVFLGCSSLSTVDFEEGISVIGNNMFALCNALKTIHIPASVKVIESFAFYACKSLEEITLAPGLERIESDSFCECHSLKTVAIPKTVLEVGARAFENCENLKKAYISKKTKYAHVFGRSFPRDTWVIKN